MNSVVQIYTQRTTLNTHASHGRSRAHLFTNFHLLHKAPSCRRPRSIARSIARCSTVARSRRVALYYSSPARGKQQPGNRLSAVYQGGRGDLHNECWRSLLALSLGFRQKSPNDYARHCVNRECLYHVLLIAVGTESYRALFIRALRCCGGGSGGGGEWRSDDNRAGGCPSYLKG